MTTEPLLLTEDSPVVKETEPLPSGIDPIVVDPEGPLYILTDPPSSTPSPPDTEIAPPEYPDPPVLTILPPLEYDGSIISPPDRTTEPTLDALLSNTLPDLISTDPLAKLITFEDPDARYADADEIETCPLDPEPLDPLLIEILPPGPDRERPPERDKDPPTDEELAAEAPPLIDTLPPSPPPDDNPAAIKTDPPGDRARLSPP